jgi:hypothetical protein
MGGTTVAALTNLLATLLANLLAEALGKGSCLPSVDAAPSAGQHFSKEATGNPIQAMRARGFQQERQGIEPQRVPRQGTHPDYPGCQQKMQQ